MAFGALEKLPMPPNHSQKTGGRNGEKRHPNYNTMNLTENRKLIAVKLLHTAIWAILAGLVFYILYAGISGRITSIAYFAIGAIIVETLVLAGYGWRCPLTLVAQKYTDANSPNFDIYLPAWLAKHNKTIFSILYVVGVALVAWRVLNN
jgi:hypothetical protein